MTRKPYTTPTITQLDAEAMFNPEAKVRKAATKWFELVKKYEQMRIDYPLSKKEKSPPSIIESLGIEAVLLIEGDG